MPAYAGLIRKSLGILRHTLSRLRRRPTHQSPPATIEYHPGEVLEVRLSRRLPDSFYAPPSPGEPVRCLTPYIDAKTEFRVRRQAAAQSDAMPTRDKQLRIMAESSQIGDHNKDELHYDDMLHLADVFEGWAMERRTGAGDSARMLGWADGFRKLAEKVGPEWRPAYPEKLSIIGFIAKKLREG